jgi:hypothetical protein
MNESDDPTYGPMILPVPQRLREVPIIEDFERVFLRFGFHVRLALVHKQKRPLSKQDVRDVEILLSAFDGSTAEGLPTSCVTAETPAEAALDELDGVPAKVMTLPATMMIELLQKCGINVTTKAGQGRAAVFANASTIFRRLPTADRAAFLAKFAAFFKPAPSPVKKAPTLTTRDKSVYDLFLAKGKNKKATADALKLTPQRIHQIVKKVEAHKSGATS